MSHVNAAGGGGRLNAQGIQSLGESDAASKGRDSDVCRWAWGVEALRDGLGLRSSGKLGDNLIAEGWHAEST